MSAGGSRLKKVVIVAALIGLVGLFYPPAANAESLSQLLARQADLQRQAQDNQRKIDQKKGQVNDLQGVIANLDNSIDDTQEKITNTQDQIIVAQEVLSELAVDIQQSQSQLDDLNLKLRNAYIGLYEMSQTSTLDSLLTSSSLTDMVTQAQYIQSLQTDLQSNIDKATATKTDLETKKGQSEIQKTGLESQKQQLESSKAELAGQKSQKSYLLGVAQSNISYYQGLSADIQKQIAEVERKISILVSQASWGSDIVSAGSTSWYYRQLDYPNVFLGGSPYTVAQYGCLITSYAMVSSFYGHAVTPPDIARYPGNFDGQGYLLRQPPPPTSLSLISSSPVNWATVNSEVDAGRPVIVSIYLPSVGQVNSDGSSHFIVINGRSGGRYLMEDPIGQGRSYAANQVRSMKIIRP